MVQQHRENPGNCRGFLLRPPNQSVCRLTHFLRLATRCPVLLLRFLLRKIKNKKHELNVFCLFAGEQWPLVNGGERPARSRWQGVRVKTSRKRCVPVTTKRVDLSGQERLFTKIYQTDISFEGRRSTNPDGIESAKWIIVDNVLVMFDDTKAVAAVMTLIE